MALSSEHLHRSLSDLLHSNTIIADAQREIVSNKRTTDEEGTDEDQVDESEAQVNDFRDGAVISNEERLNQVEEKGKFPLFVFFMGVFSRLKAGFQIMLLSDGFSWWPFWRQEKRLELLVSEADPNPKDATKQSALLVELNKHG